MALGDILRFTVLCIIFKETDFRSLVKAQGLPEIVEDPINYYTTVELACSEGYPIQEHKIFTEDGYFLLIHRIPRGRILPKIPRRSSHYHKIHLNHHPDFDDCVRESMNLTSNGFPVVLTHGLLMATDAWLLQGSGKDLAYLLADEGFDVWMPNLRGNFYTRKHKTLKPSDPQFWNFSFHEHAVYDLPAIIDHVIRVTKVPKIGFLGYSMGSTAFFAMASVQPEYNEKVLGFVGYAPVAYIKEKHMSPGRKSIFGFLNQLGEETLRIGKVQEIFPRLPGLVNFGRNYCSMGSVLQDFCYDFFTIFFGYPSKLVLRLFDYGEKKNIEVYGTPTPPDYPLWNITTPVALFYTTGDFFYDSKDIQDLLKVLPNVVEVDAMDKFNHADFLWAFNGKDKLFPKVVSFFKELRDQNCLRRKKSLTFSGKLISVRVRN